MSERDQVAAHNAAMHKARQRELGVGSVEPPAYLAVDAHGYVWRIWADGYWSMARINPGQQVEPVTYYAPTACPGCGMNIPPKVAACEDCRAQANVDPGHEEWGAWQ